jgi:hypothetical protein
VIDFLHVLTDLSAQLLDVSAAGLLLADPRGELRVSRVQPGLPGCWSCSSCRTTRPRRTDARNEQRPVIGCSDEPFLDRLFPARRVQA